MTGGDEPLPPREDRALPLFEAPAGEAPGRRIGAAAPELVVVAPAAPRPFLLEGSAAVVRGVESRGPCEVRFPAVPLVTTVAREVGVVANTMVSPGRIRRERVGRGPSVVETVMAAPELPLVVFDWAAGGAAGGAARSDAGRSDGGGAGRPDASGAGRPDAGVRDAPIEVLIQARPEGAGADPELAPGAIRYHAGARAVTFAFEREPAHRGGRAGPGGPPADLLVVALAGAGTPTEWTVEAAPGGAVRCSTGPNDASTLLVGGGAPDAVRTALRASAHAAVHERRSVAPAGHGSVGLTTGVVEVDDGFAWAATRVGFGVRRTGPGGEGEAAPPGLLWCGLAAAALGDDEGAARCFGALLDAAENGAAALVAGRLALSTGRVREALACAQWALGEASEAGPAGLSTEAATALADGLRYAMSDEALDRLRASATASPAPRPGEVRTSGARRLPTLGGGDAPTGPDPRTRPAGLSSHAVEARAAWARFASDPDAGWVAWRNLISAGLNGSIHGAGAWDDPAGYDPPAAAAFLIVGLLRGMLGAEPDAPVGRLRLAPRFPAHFTRFGVRGLPVGDARVALEYFGTPDRHRFVVTPTQGRVPPLLVFEPVVPGEVQEVRIDEAVADVDLVRMGPRTLFRLQTPLDAGRTIDAIRGL